MSKSHPISTRSTFWWASLAIVLFLIVGVSTVLLQKELRRSQENRGQATVANGIVTVEHDTSMVLAGNQSVVLLKVNTHDAMLQDINLDFDVLYPSQAASGAPVFDPNISISNQNPALATSHYDVNLLAQNAATGESGWTVKMTLSAIGDQGFTTGQNDEGLLRIELNLPKVVGELKLKFNQANSTALMWADGNGSRQDILTPITTIAREIYQDNCQYTYSEWGSCTNGQQTRTVLSGDTNQCPTPHSAMTAQKCFTPAPQCRYVYTDWGTCANGYQTRAYSERAVDGATLINNNPTLCYFYQSETLQPLSQQCQMPVVETAPTQGFSTYTYETCWNDRSEGASTYIIWDKNAFPGATKIDVSTTSDFKGYANKTVAGATNDLDNNYLATDATNFRTYTDGKNAQWIFWPGYTYYFRMYYGADQHTGVISYFVPKCAGTGGINYKQCNESCSANKDCSSNLSCISGVCRRADNADSNICAAPPDRGIKRACNEYCSDSSECGNGLTCWWNRCRAPKNLDSTSCQAPKKTTYVYSGDGYAAPGKGAVVYAGSADSAPASTTPESSCNENCKTNRDCAANLRCFQGSCRLPSNVASAQCLTVKEAQAATLSATVQMPEEEVPIIEEPIVEEQASGFTALAQWLVGRIGFLLVGLLVAVAILMIWPLLRPRAQEPTTYRSYPSPNTGSTPSNTVVQKPISQMMTPPRQEP